MRSLERRVADYFGAWTCVGCGAEFASRFDHPPIGVKLGERQMSDGRWERFEVGDLCSKCMSPHQRPDDRPEQEERDDGAPR